MHFHMLWYTCSEYLTIEASIGVVFIADTTYKTNTVNIGFCNHPPSEGSRLLKPARPLKQGSGYSDQVVAKARVWV